MPLRVNITQMGFTKDAIEGSLQRMPLKVNIIPWVMFNATKTTFWRLLQFIVQTCIVNFWHISCISELQTCGVKFAFDHDYDCKEHK